METINYKDSFVKVYHLKKLQMYLNPRKCYCCNENIGSDENVILMINNHKYIPNMLLHEVCYNSFTNKENFIGNIEKKTIENIKSRMKFLETSKMRRS